MASNGPKPQRELGKHKAQLRKLEREKEKSFPGLGEAAYQAFLEGRITDESLLSICGGIRDIDSQIEQEKEAVERLKADIEQLKAAKKKPGVVCPHCGAPMDQDARFCPNCGQAPMAAQIPAAPEPSGNNCASCGAPLSPDARFCGNCGQTAMIEEPAAEAAPPTPPTAPATPETEEHPAAPAGAMPPPPPTASAPPPPPGTEDAGPGNTVEEKPGRKCPSCFAIIVEEEAVFCGECGTKLE